jgi:hypothetical protein
MDDFPEQIFKRFPARRVKEHASRLFLADRASKGGADTQRDEDSAGNVTLSTYPAPIAAQPSDYRARRQGPHTVTQDAHDRKEDT